MRKTTYILIFSILPILAKAAFGVFGSAIYIEQNGNTQFFNCFGSNIGSQPFSGSLGVFVQNTATLKIQGAELKTWKDGNGNVCGGTLYYRTFLTSNGPSGTFAPVSLPFFCNCVSNSFPCGGGSCSGNDQKWQKPGGGSVANIDLTTSSPGQYTLEVYYDVNGNANGTTDCPNTQSDNNGGFNYTATYTIQTSLAIDLMAFSAKALGPWNEISWQTPKVADPRTYELERSTAEDNWTTLHTTDDPNSLSYTYKDLHPLVHNYYRLKSTSIGGAISHSPIIYVENKSHKIHIFPNPTSDKIEIAGVDDPNNSVVLIINPLGRIILEQHFSEILNVTNISSGMYILKIINYQNGTSFTTRLTRL